MDCTAGQIAHESVRCDVLVVGAGLAGVSATIEAARAGAKVVLSSLGPVFSGSSFYGGTWGLGLIGPEDEQDADELAATIAEVGCGVADPALSRILVDGVAPAIAWLEEMDVVLRKPEDAGQREFIPCFDHKSRLWRGLERTSLRRAWTAELERLDVDIIEHAQLLDILEEDGVIAGAHLACLDRNAVLTVSCGALVLATGGLAGLYERRLTAGDAAGAAQGVALAHGCTLANAEFLQMMPGYVSPVSGVVANEKAWRYSDLPFASELLEERSGYGPFSSRFAAREIDLAIEAAGEEGLAVSWKLPDVPPELVASYFDWLERDFSVSAQDEARVAMFAHASNGGIRIGADASCEGGPAGLFAAGECTGGMHGADRLGGLASAAALVFGQIAGGSAAAVAGRGDGPAQEAEPELRGSAAADELDAELRRTMGAHAMVARSEAGLLEARTATEALAQRLTETAAPACSLSCAARSALVGQRLRSAQAMLDAMLARRESLGSHYRVD